MTENTRQDIPISTEQQTKKKQNQTTDIINNNDKKTGDNHTKSNSGKNVDQSTSKNDSENTDQSTRKNDSRKNDSRKNTSQQNNDIEIESEKIIFAEKASKQKIGMTIKIQDIEWNEAWEIKNNENETFKTNRVTDIQGKELSIKWLKETQGLNLTIDNNNRKVIVSVKQNWLKEIAKNWGNILISTITGITYKIIVIHIKKFLEEKINLDKIIQDRKVIKIIKEKKNNEEMEIWYRISETKINTLMESRKYNHQEQLKVTSNIRNNNIRLVQLKENREFQNQNWLNTIKNKKTEQISQLRKQKRSHELQKIRSEIQRKQRLEQNLISNNTTTIPIRSNNTNTSRITNKGQTTEGSNDIQSNTYNQLLQEVVEETENKDPNTKELSQMLLEQIDNKNRTENKTKELESKVEIDITTDKEINKVEELLNFMEEFTIKYEETINDLQKGNINRNQYLEKIVKWNVKERNGIIINDPREIGEILAINTNERERWGKPLNLTAKIIKNLINDKENIEIDEDTNNKFQYNTKEIIKTSEKVISEMIYVYNLIIKTTNKLYEILKRMNIIKEKQMITTTTVNITYLVKELSLSIMTLTIKLQNLQKKLNRNNIKTYNWIVNQIYHRMQTTLQKKMIDDVQGKIDIKIKKQQEYKEFDGYIRINQEDKLNINYTKKDSINEEIKEILMEISQQL
ncbi:hypothetical protein RFI_37775, partial [Reticulomyxa filosa]